MLKYKIEIYHLLYDISSKAGEALSELIRGLIKAGMNLRDLVIVGHSLGALYCVSVIFLS